MRPSLFCPGKCPGCSENRARLDLAALRDLNRAQMAEDLLNLDALLAG